MKQRIHALMVDDRENDYVLTAAYLAESEIAHFTVEWARSYDEGVARVSEKEYDIILLDYYLGSKNGLELMNTLIALGVTTPLVFLTGKESHDTDLAVLRSGADDYLSKDYLSPYILERTILRAIERRRLTYELKKSEAKFRAVFEDTQIGMALVNREGHVTEANEAATAILGYDVLTGKSMATLITTDGALLGELIGHCHKVRSVQVCNALTDGGKSRWAQLTICPINELTLPKNADSMMVIIFRDVTGEVTAERERAMLAAFPAQNPYPVMRLTREGACDFANQSAQSIFTNGGEGIDQSAYAPLRDPAIEALNNNAPRDIVLPVGERTYRFSLAPVATIDRIYIFGREITEERRIMGELRRSSLVFTTTNDGVMITDGQGDIRSINDSFTRITGYCAENALGKNPRIMKSNRHSQEFYRTLWRELLTLGKWEGEIWNRRKDGELYLQHSHIRSVTDDEGNVTEFVNVFRDVTSVMRQREELQRRAYNDSLTGLPNRLLFQDRLETTISRTLREQRPIALLYLDLDGFKSANDTFGHITGDKILQWVAENVSQHIRAEDTLARLGGDEFALIIERFDEKQEIVALSQRIHQLFSGGVSIEEITVPVTASIGVSIYPWDTSDITELISFADTAMYCAKRNGKATTVFHGRPDDGLPAK